MGQKISSSNGSMMYFCCNIPNFCPFFIQLCQKVFILTHGTLYQAMLGHTLRSLKSFTKGCVLVSVLCTYTLVCHLQMVYLTSRQQLFLPRLYMTTFCFVTSWMFPVPLASALPSLPQCAKSAHITTSLHSSLSVLALPCPLILSLSLADTRVSVMSAQITPLLINRDIDDSPSVLP